jgi:hypothetical protein
MMMMMIFWVFETMCFWGIFRSLTATGIARRVIPPRQSPQLVRAKLLW